MVVIILAQVADIIPQQTLGQQPPLQMRLLQDIITQQSGQDTEMIVWGGYDGGYFNKEADIILQQILGLQPSTTNAPSARYNYTAVWTGTEMIVWGGTALVTSTVEAGIIPQQTLGQQPPLQMRLSQGIITQQSGQEQR